MRHEKATRTFLLGHGKTKIMMVAIVLGVLLSPTLVSAHRLGGQFRHTPGTNLYIGYTQNGGYRTPVVNAASSWHATPTRVYVFQESIASSEVDFYTQWRSESWWGLAVHHPCYGGGSGCTYSYAELYLNSRTLASESDFTRQKVAAHEFGHAIGLAHTSDWWYTSIMKQGRLSYNTPRTHDINDTNGIYR